MRKTFLYYLILTLTWPMQLVPYAVHYFISDLLAFFAGNVFRYRRQVISQNIDRAFPNKDAKWKSKVVIKFYRNFIDMFIETLYLTHINIRKNSHRLVVADDELIKSLQQQGKNIICVTGHFGNWEMANLYANRVTHQLYLVYKQLSSKTFDQFYSFVRGRGGAIPVEMNQIARQLLVDRQQKKTFMAYFISDQRPQWCDNVYWMTFLNQDTPVFKGTEKIAQKTDASVVWASIRRHKRGCYTLSFELLFENAAQTSPGQITEAFMKKLEKAIENDPDQYLWSHNRWKHKRPADVEVK